MTPASSAAASWAAGTLRSVLDTSGPRPLSKNVAAPATRPPINGTSQRVSASSSAVARRWESRLVAEEL